MNIEMLPVVVLLTKEIDFNSIPYLVWSRIKENVEFNRVAKGQRQSVENVYVILV